mmetsp:Transcript_9521/g.21173  ORF Transcript_9521/g.21173 Transcript_9521/m.21173 type:complete len:669 (+) Transcript_9521:43-2049(+)
MASSLVIGPVHGVGRPDWGDRWLPSEAQEVDGTSTLSEVADTAGLQMEQFTVYRHEQAAFRAELSGLQMDLEGERAARGQGLENCRRDVEESRRHAERCIELLCEKVESLGRQLTDSQEESLRDRAARESSGQAMKGEFQELKEAFLSERRGREKALQQFRLEVEETRNELEQEGEQRLRLKERMEQELQTLRGLQDASAAAQTATAQDFCRQLLEVTRATVAEQQAGTVLEANMKRAMEELRGSFSSLQHQIRAPSRGSGGGVAARGDDTLEVLRTELASQQQLTGLSRQYSAMAESLQEEQFFRASEDAELSRMVEAIRNGAAEVRKRQGDLEATVSSLAVTLSRRSQDAVPRETETTKLSRLLEEERAARLEREAKSGRSLAALAAKVEDQSQTVCEVAARLDRLWTAVTAEQREQEERFGRQVRQLKEAVAASSGELKELLESDRAANKAQLRLATERTDEALRNTIAAQQRLSDFSEGAREGQQALAAHQHDRAAVEAALTTRLEELEAQLEGLEFIGQSTVAAQKKLEGRLEPAKFNCLCADMLVEEGPFKLGIEGLCSRLPRLENGSDGPLEVALDDFRDEVKATRSEVATLWSRLEDEASLRMETVQVIDLALQECRDGILSIESQIDVVREAASARDAPETRALAAVLRPAHQQNLMSG